LVGATQATMSDRASKARAARPQRDDAARPQTHRDVVETARREAEMRVSPTAVSGAMEKLETASPSMRSC